MKSMRNTTRAMAKLIRAAFRKSGLSMKTPSERSGVPYATVHGIIQGYRDPALSSVERICDVLRLKLVGQERKRKGK